MDLQWSVHMHQTLLLFKGLFFDADRVLPRKVAPLGFTLFRVWSIYDQRHLIWNACMRTLLKETRFSHQKQAVSQSVFLPGLLYCSLLPRLFERFPSLTPCFRGQSLRQRFSYSLCSICYWMRAIKACKLERRISMEGSRMFGFKFSFPLEPTGAWSSAAAASPKYCFE